MKAQDGRKVRGRIIKQQVREKIINAYQALLRRAVLFPTAAEIAAEAGVSRRVIFDHFADLSALRIAAAAQIEAISRTFISHPHENGLSAEQRLRLFISQHTRMLEEVTPLRRVGMALAYRDPIISRTLKQVRANALRDLERAVHSALGALSPAEKKKLLIELHTVCAWPSWETLRADHGLKIAAARAAMTECALAILSRALSTRQPHVYQS